jgi:polysaccharide biosynthesis protein VpsM
MKNAIRSSVAIAAIGVAAQAAPFTTIGQDAELFFTGTAGIRADDNVLLSGTKTSDVIFEFTPGLDLVFGNNSMAKGHIFFKEAFSSYADNSKLDTNLSTVGINTKYDDAKLKMNFDAGWSQIAQNTVDVRAGYLVRRDVSNIGGGSEISLTDKSSVGAAVTYEQTDYKRQGFVDSDITSVPLNIFYEITPKVDASFGLRYRDSNLTGGNSSEDYFYNVGVRGEFSEKLNGNIAVGYTQRDFSAGGNEDTVGVDSSLNYLFNEKTSFSLGATNDFGTSGQGASQKNLSFRAGVQSKISEVLSVGANLSHRSITYLGNNGRTDEYFEGNLSATYIVNAYANVVGGFTFRQNSSKLAGGDFDNSVFSLAANFRY